MQAHRAEQQGSGLSVGARIELRRHQFGLSRRVVANLVGRSEEWLRLVESGRQSLDSIRIIASLAEVLGIENIAELIEWSTGRHAINRDSGQDHILELFKHAIVDPLDINAAASSPNVSIEELRHGLVRCEEIWHSSGSAILWWRSCCHRSFATAADCSGQPWILRSAR